MIRVDQLSVDMMEEVASLSVFQMAEGWDFLLISWWKYSILALRCSQTTQFP